MAAATLLFPDRQLRQQWRRFVQEHFWLDTLQLGQLLLLALALFTLLLLLMSAFCCCFPYNAKRRRRRKSAQQLQQHDRSTIHRIPTGFSSTNEERRRLLQRQQTSSSGTLINANRQAESGNEQQQQQQQQSSSATTSATTTDVGTVVGGGGGEQTKHLAKERSTNAAKAHDDAGDDGRATTDRALLLQRAEERPKLEAAVAPATAPPVRRFPQPLTPYVGYRRPLVEQSPPPPRRFVPYGRTQVLPLTAMNQRRVPVLMLLMADQEQQQQQQQQRQFNGTAPAGIPDSRTTTTTNVTGGVKSCATIPEDPETCNNTNNNNEELMSIDRTLLSNSTTIVNSSTENVHQEAEPKAPIRNVVRLASPFPQPPPEFELPVPSYAPPEPPAPSEITCRLANGSKRCAGDGMRTRSNLSSPDPSSYGGQTALNTTTTNSTGSIGIEAGADCQRGGSRVRISELECSDAGAPRCSPPQQQQHNHLESQQQGMVGMHFGILAGGRVPRSISQQLELMELAEAAAAAATEQRKCHQQQP